MFLFIPDDGSQASFFRLGAFENFIRAEIMSFLVSLANEKSFGAITMKGDLTSLHLWDNVKDNNLSWAMLQGPDEGYIGPKPSWH